MFLTGRARRTRRRWGGELELGFEIRDLRLGMGMG